MAFVVRHIEQVRFAGLLLQLVARTLVVGVVHINQPLRRLDFQVQLAVGHCLCKLGILLGIVTAHLVGVNDAMPVP